MDAINYVLRNKATNLFLGDSGKLLPLEGALQFTGYLPAADAMTKLGLWDTYTIARVRTKVSRIKKPAYFAPAEYAKLLNKLSKQALIDICWNMAALGTDESPEEMISKVAREAVIVCDHRGDFCDYDLRKHARYRISADGPNDDVLEREPVENVTG